MMTPLKNLLREGFINHFPLIAVMVLYAALTLPWLTTFPPVDYQGDESWDISLSSEILRSGRPVAPLHEGTLMAREGLITTRWLYDGSLALGLAAFGVSVWSARFVSFLMGLVALWATYALGAQMGGRRTGTGAAAMLACTIMFSRHAREARPEILTMGIAAIVALLFYRALREADPRRAGRYLFGAGLAATLSVQSHMIGSLYAFSLIVLAPAYFGRRIFSSTGAMMIAGMAAGTLAWLLFNYMPFSAEAFKGIHAGFVPPILTSSITSLLAAGLSKPLEVFSPMHLSYLSSNYGTIYEYYLIYVCGGVILAGLIAGGARREIGFLMLMILAPLLIGEFIAQWNWFNYSMFLPFASIALALSAGSLVNALPGGAKLRAAGYYLMILLTCLAGAYDIAQANAEASAYDFEDFSAEMSAAIEPGARVMGMEVFSLPLVRQGGSFVSFMFVQEGCPDFNEAIPAFGPDYILLDRSFLLFSNQWCMGNTQDAYFNQAVMPYLYRHATLVNTLDIKYPNAFAPGGRIGQVMVFRSKKGS